MSLLRFAARSMLASFFVVNGAKAIANPEPLVGEAEPLAASFVPLAQRVAPPSLAHYIPSQTTTLVRVTGAAQVVGGLMLATGFGRRIGAGLLGVSLVPHVIASRPSKQSTPEERKIAKAHLQRNVALLGGVILAALDTEGKPDLAWLAADRKKKVTAEAGRASKHVAASAKRTSAAVAASGGRTSRRAKREARRLAKRVGREAAGAKKSLAKDLELAKKNAQLAAVKAQRDLGAALS